MKKNKSALFLLSSLSAALLLASCGTETATEIRKTAETLNDEKVTIHILHQEDYMDESLLDEFMEEYPNVKVVFETTDTNETLYNELRTGKADYNLVTVSEYMVQRLASEGLIQKINFPTDLTEDGKSVYSKAVSRYLSNPDAQTDEEKGVIDKIRVLKKKTNRDDPDEDIGALSEYTMGYMWGTLGTVVNPYFKTYVEKGMSDKVVSDLRGIEGWSTFWNPEYKGTHSIKESMRDTYALGIFEVFKDKFLDPSLDYDYKNKVLFNDHSKGTIQKVKDILIDLKSNIFGFEVDSGKNDIVTGKIGMNLAWSGDAAFSILKGQYYPGPDEDYTEEKPDDKKTILYYNIPKIGANIWFDGVCIPSSTDPNSLEYKYTCAFIDFISRPENAVKNMSTTGFTSFIAGEDVTEGNAIADFVRETFDFYTINDLLVEEGEEPMEVPEGLIDYDISYFFNGIERGVEGKEMVMHVTPESYEGRLLVAQYPEESDIDHLYVMEDYGEDNGKIVQMWEDIKVNPLPIWVVVALISFVVISLAYLGSYKIIKAYRVKKRKSLRYK